MAESPSGEVSDWRDIRTAPDKLENGGILAWKPNSRIEVEQLLADAAIEKTAVALRRSPSFLVSHGARSV